MSATANDMPTAGNTITFERPHRTENDNAPKLDHKGNAAH